MKVQLPEKTSTVQESKLEEATPAVNERRVQLMLVEEVVEQRR